LESRFEIKFTSTTNQILNKLSDSGIDFETLLNNADVNTVDTRYLDIGYLDTPDMSTSTVI